MTNLEIQSDIYTTAIIASADLESYTVLLEKEEDSVSIIFGKTNIRMVSKT